MFSLLYIYKSSARLRFSKEEALYVMVSNLANNVFPPLSYDKPKYNRLLVLNYNTTSWPILPASVSDIR